MSIDAINIRHLQAVAVVAECGSLSAAAELVHLTQPALTQGIARLERLVGHKLFDRQPGGMAPTPAGQILAARGAAVLRILGTNKPSAAQIRALTALARHGSYAEAARATGLREPTLHRAIGDLSIVLEQRLVERRGKGVALTERGQAIARRFRLARAELASALADLAALEGHDGGRIAIGAMPLSRARLLPNSVVAFHRSNPQTDIVILEGSYLELAGSLREGDIDFMIGAIRGAEAASDFIEEPLFDDRPIILARPGHPLQGKPVTIQNLLDYPWTVAAEGTPLRRQWRAMFEAAGHAPPRIPIECGSAMVARQLVVQTDFLMLLSPDQMVVELEAGWLVKIADAPGNISRTIGIISRADWRPTRIQALFLDGVRAQAAAIRARDHD